MLLGAHVSIAGGVQNAPGNGTDIGAETIQIFAKNQRQWKAKPYSDEEIAAFHEEAKAAGYDQTTVHASYLINLGAVKEEVHQRSLVTFRDEMVRCQALGIPYLIFHPGAHVGAGEAAGIKKIIASIQAVLAQEDDNPTMLLVENTAGQGSVVGHTFEQVAEILDGVDDPRMACCLDTAHCLAAGYNLATPDGYEDTLRRFDDTIGLKRLRALHLNDAKTPLGSKVDRHANLGDGEIGWGLFERLVNDPRLAGLPGNLETPGGPEGWKEEIAQLKAARKKGAPDADPR